jgi:hypothetical protein
MTATRKRNLPCSMGDCARDVPGFQRSNRFERNLAFFQWGYIKDIAYRNKSRGLDELETNIPNVTAHDAADSGWENTLPC